MACCRDAGVDMQLSLAGGTTPRCCIMTSWQSCQQLWKHTSQRGVQWHILFKPAGRLVHASFTYAERARWCRTEREGILKHVVGCTVCGNHSYIVG